MKTTNYYKSTDPDGNVIVHYGIKGMKKGVRRFQREDGTYTSAGMNRYDIGRSTPRYGGVSSRQTNVKTGTAQIKRRGSGLGTGSVGSNQNAAKRLNGGSQNRGIISTQSTITVKPYKEWKDENTKPYTSTTNTSATSAKKMSAADKAKSYLKKFTSKVKNAAGNIVKTESGFKPVKNSKTEKYAKWIADHAKTKTGDARRKSLKRYKEKNENSRAQKEYDELKKNRDKERKNRQAADKIVNTYKQADLQNRNTAKIYQNTPEGDRPYYRLARGNNEHGPSVWGSGSQKIKYDKEEKRRMQKAISNAKESSDFYKVREDYYDRELKARRKKKK